MRENKYDDTVFFTKYSQMDRSQKGLEASGEWHVFKHMLPDLRGKRFLDLGCGYGWHCIYAKQHGASRVTGVDLSEKMLQIAKKKTGSGYQIEYIRQPIEDIDFPENSFDIVISSLAFHYVEYFENICRKVSACLSQAGSFIFSVEHPVFTAQGRQDWIYNQAGERLHWPVDRYFNEGARDTVFLGENVTKYHRTLTTYVKCLIAAGFEIVDIIEPRPEKRQLDAIPEMSDELRRPMMLLISARKQ